MRLGSVVVAGVVVSEREKELEDVCMEMVGSGVCARARVCVWLIQREKELENLKTIRDF